MKKKMKWRFALLLCAIAYCTLPLVAQVRNEKETIFPAEGSITEAQWGTYLLSNVAAQRNIRLGVSNDLYTRAEIQLDNRNTAHGRIYFRTINRNAPAVTRMTIQSNGKVGIGTTDPKELLSVNGNMRAKEIKVEASNWPDYVFEQGYNLLPLDELENHIKRYGHLPDIPKAKEVEEEGISLGEMNTLLLKKVEELTLHLIEKDKALNQVMERLDKLESKLNQ